MPPPVAENPSVKLAQTDRLLTLELLIEVLERLSVRVGVALLTANGKHTLVAAVLLASPE
jgi:bifunctional DNase/RNase